MRHRIKTPTSLPKRTAQRWTSPTVQIKKGFRSVEAPAEGRGGGGEGGAKLYMARTLVSRWREESQDREQPLEGSMRYPLFHLLDPSYFSPSPCSKDRLTSPAVHVFYYCIADAISTPSPSRRSSNKEKGVDVTSLRL